VGWLGPSKEKAHVKYLVTTGFVAALALVSAAANAQEAPFTAGKPQVGASLQYGIYTGDDVGDLNPYGLGFGLRGGYTLDMNLFVGASFEYYLGGSEDVLGEDVSFNMYSFMLEPGYDIAVGEGLVLRPQLGIGFTWEHFDAPEPIGGTTENDFAIAPGVQFLADVGGVFIQAGAKYHHIFVEDGNADGFLLNAGVGLTF
jgi:hypothetical protein